MDVYTIGRLLLPGVIGIMVVAGILMVMTVIFTFMRILSYIRQFLQSEQEPGSTTFPINIFPVKQSSKPPMQD